MHRFQIAQRIRNIKTYYHRTPSIVPKQFHAKYYTFLFTVYCYRLFRSANRSGTMVRSVRADGRFQVSKSCNLLHCWTKSRSHLALCRHLTGLETFRLGVGNSGKWTRLVRGVSDLSAIISYKLSVSFRNLLKVFRSNEPISIQQ